jgi:hypothetical protein
MLDNYISAEYNLYFWQKNHCTHLNIGASVNQLESKINELRILNCREICMFGSCPWIAVKPYTRSCCFCLFITTFYLCHHFNCSETILFSSALQAIGCSSKSKINILCIVIDSKKECRFFANSEHQIFTVNQAPLIPIVSRSYSSR